MAQNKLIYSRFFMAIQMEKSTLTLMIIGIIAATVITSSLLPATDAKIKRGCNENTNLQTGNPHGDNNPGGNPHDNNQAGNPHNECVS
jgi:hypothetical protein